MRRRCFGGSLVLAVVSLETPLCAGQLRRALLLLLMVLDEDFVGGELLVLYLLIHAELALDLALDVRERGVR